MSRERFTSASAIESIVREFASRLEDAIRHEVANRLDAAVAEALRKSERKEPGARAATGRRPQRMCPVPGCGLPAAGPRYGWKCRDHASLSKAEVSKLVAAGSTSEGVAVVRLP